MRELTVLTGASRGLGYAIWQELSLQKQEVVVMTRQDNGLFNDGITQNILFDLRKITKPGAMDMLIGQLQAVAQSGHFDRLTFINNAGAIEPIDKIGDVDPAQFLDAVSVNFIAPSLIANACAAMAKRFHMRLRVLNISSGAANYPIGGWASYCSTKSATKMFMDVLRKDMDCEVVHIDPGVMDTSMQSTIRLAPASSFPDAKNFIALAEEGKLNDPVVVGKRIVADHYGVA